MTPGGFFFRILFAYTYPAREMGPLRFLPGGSGELNLLQRTLKFI